jgi:hypothetical protein
MQIAERWHDLHVGDQLTFDWPRPEKRHRRPTR